MTSRWSTPRVDGRQAKIGGLRTLKKLNLWTQKILRTNSINFQKDLRGTTSVICGREPEQSYFLKDDSRLPTNSEIFFGANLAGVVVKLSWVRVVALLERW